MFKKIIENEGSLFIIKILAVYALWTIVRESFNNLAVLFPYWMSFNDYFAERYIVVSSWILENFFDYNLVYNKRNIIPTGFNGVFIGNFCLGVSAKFIFTGIIMSLKGKWLHKIWFIPLGLLMIAVINSARIVMLTKFLTEGKMVLFDLSHDYVYVLAVYSAIFGMIILWEKKFTKTI